MDDAPVLTDQSLAGMLAALTAEPSATRLDLTGAVRRSGWESVVLETPGWIVRFPRRPEIPFATEVAVLAHVRGRLPVETPEVAWTGVRTRCMAYPRIAGTRFTPDTWRRAGRRDRRVLGASFADLLVAWRDAFDAEDVLRLGIEPLAGTPYLAQLRSTLSRFDRALRPALHRLLVRYARLVEEERASAGTGVLHGDFGPGNMVLDASARHVTGLWDFSCVAVGVPSWDLHYLAGALGDPAGDPEPPGSGRHLDLVSEVTGRLVAAGFAAPDPVLADVMCCVEWIGDHDPADAGRWKAWLDRLDAVVPVPVPGADGV